MPIRMYEDNAAALSLAINQKVTSRTKHVSVKFHFFWEHVNDPNKYIKWLKVESKNQRATYFTKGLMINLIKGKRFVITIVVTGDHCAITGIYLLFVG